MVGFLKSHLKQVFFANTCFFTSVKLFGVHLCQDLLRERSWLQKDCYVLCTCLEGCVITYSIMSVNKKQEWLKFRPTNIPYSNDGTGKLFTSFRTEHQQVCPESYIFTKVFSSRCMFPLFLKAFESRCSSISSYEQQQKTGAV